MKLKIFNFIIYSLFLSAFGIIIFLLEEHIKKVETLSNDLKKINVRLSENDSKPSKVEGCYFISKDDFIKSMQKLVIEKNLKGLEIDAYSDPSLRSGTNSKYWNIFKPEKLIEYAKNDLGLEESALSHFIHHSETEPSITEKKETFDIIYSRHTIEHQIDLISHLNQLYDLLNEGGKVYLLVPDKRYTCDYFSPETPLSEIIAVHESDDKVHSLQTILSKCEAGHNFSMRHWKGDHGKMQVASDPNCYKNYIQEFRDSKGQYIDAHKWRVTPQSFEYIINSLNKLGYIKLTVDKIYCTSENSSEFAVILSRN